MALTDGRALPASALAAEADVAASTISEHLARLLAARLVIAERQGRSRYYRLADFSVAEALEALARISPPKPIRSLRQGSYAYALRYARTCYNHLAGRLGVALMTALLDSEILVGDLPRTAAFPAERDRLAAPGREVSYRITDTGRQTLLQFGLDLDAIERHRPPMRYCVDWSEQRHHLAGALGTALTTRLLELDWIRRGARPRAATLTDSGRVGLHEVFGLPCDWDQAA
jgi:DNA-binding transcriptional ArsR family regulator